MSSFSVRRGQIPVGQGCFSFGHITLNEPKDDASFLYVHDCGGKLNLIKDALDNNVLPAKQIDILYISHFDEDHVRGLRLLLKSRKITCSYIPQLDESSRTLILAACLAKGKLSAGLRAFILNPTKWLLDKGCDRVIEIGSEPAPLDRLVEGDDLDQTQKSIFKVGGTDSKLNISIVANGSIEEIWNLISFSYVDKDKKFLKKISDHFKLGFHSDASIRKWMLDHADPKDIKNFFISIGELDHNRVSLCLFSGPSLKIKEKTDLYIERFICRCCIFLGGKMSLGKSGWLHTADYPFRLKQCKLKFGDYFKNEFEEVQSFMLSHHGADIDFKADMLDWMPNMEFGLIPVGSTRQYGHPSPEAIREIHLRRMQPVLVMDKKEDLFLVEERFSY